MSYAPVPNAALSPHISSGNVEGSAENMSHRSKEDIELKPVALPHINSSELFSDELPGHMDAAHLARAHNSKPSTSSSKAGRIIRNIWLTTFLPVVAFGYLAFCYAAATHVVPVRVYKIDEPAKHLYGIKAGVTTITIIIVAIALLPLKSLLDDIKSEEFFRALRVSKSGVPMKTINSISIPSHGLFRSMLSVMQNYTSKYYAGTIICSVLAAVISSLAPAALSVGIIYLDSDLMAFRVGAIDSNSILNWTAPNLVNVNAGFTQRCTEAASMGWVRAVLGVDVKFMPTSSKYAVPVPVNIDSSARGRYLTDVIVMDPVCTWAVSDPPIVPPANTSALGAGFNVTLPAFGVRTQISISKFDTYSEQPKMLSILGEAYLWSSGNLVNISTSDIVTDGTAAWMISQCTSCDVSKLYSTDRSVLDLSEIPTQELAFSVTSGNTTTTREYLLSFLVCTPRISIETREVHMDGTGKLEVMEPSGLRRQGNIHDGQTGVLLARSLAKYTSDSGPESGYDGIGKAGQVGMFFGPNSTLTPVLKPQPVANITEGYLLAQQAALRSYLSGLMASSYVPGRIQATKLVFTSSLPHVIVSTVLFACVSLFINICYLRSDTEQFTLFSVASALAHSNVGRVCEDVKYADRARGALPEDVALRSLGDRKIRLANNGGPGHSLYME